MAESMTPDELMAWKAAELEKYNADVAKKWAEAKKPTEREMVVIDTIYPGYRNMIESFMDIEINESARKQAKKIIKALDVFDGR